MQVTASCVNLWVKGSHCRVQAKYDRPTFYDNHSRMVEGVKDLVESPLVVTCNFVVANKLLLWPWQRDGTEIRMLPEYIKF